MELDNFQKFGISEKIRNFNAIFRPYAIVGGSNVFYLPTRYDINSLNMGSIEELGKFGDIIKEDWGTGEVWEMWRNMGSLREHGKSREH